MSNIGTSMNAPINVAELESIESILGDMELDPTIVEASAVEEIETPVEEITELDPEQERQLEAAIARSEVYEEQPAGEPIVAADEAPAPTKAAKTPRTPKVPGTPRAARDINALPNEAFILTDEAPADLDANKAAVLTLRPTQVKIAEKFDNILMALAAGKRPSVYVMDCFKTLKAAGTVKSTDLMAAITASTTKGGSGKALGTARSQAGQIMHLFDVLGIADRSGNTLTIRPNSVLADKLAAL